MYLLCFVTCEQRLPGKRTDRQATGRLQVHGQLEISTVNIIEGKLVRYATASSRQAALDMAA